VDGPAGSGKSSVSFELAQRLGYIFADTGMFYRAVTFLALERDLDFDNPDQLTALASSVHLDLTPELADDGRQCTILADGRDITPYIHSPQVDAHVSIVAAISGVRAALLDVQRAVAARKQVIMAGRDIGTVVLPDADLKIYIDASLEQRALRRYRQRIAHGDTTNLDSIRNGLSNRDRVDSERATAPLYQAEDAIYLDTSDLSFAESVEAAYRIVTSWQAHSAH
jgi:cytidylate kinase